MNRWLARLAAIAAALVFVMPVSAQEPFSPGLRSVKIVAADFERSAAFYRALGMRDGPKREDVWDMVWDTPDRNSGVVLVSPAYGERAGMTSGGTYLMVMTTEIATLARNLRAAGYTDFGEPVSMGGMAMVLMLEDPDGNQIEVLGPVR